MSGINFDFNRFSLAVLGGSAQAWQTARKYFRKRSGILCMK
jgi:hypothetical protein